MNQDNKVPQLISSGGFQHDHVRCLIILWAQHHGYQAYSEPLGYGEYKPDLVLRRKRPKKGSADIVYIEIQKNISQEWVRKKYEQYLPKTLIIINLNIYLGRYNSPEALYEALGKQMDLETGKERPKPEKRLKRPTSDAQDDYYVTLASGKRCLKRNEWKYTGTK